MPKKVKKTPSSSPLLPHYAEMNVHYLGLISIQRQIDKKDWRWRIEETRNGRQTVIECLGNQEYGVPHGNDNDFYNAIIHQYVENNMPEDGVVQVTAYELLKLSGKTDNNQNYDALRESLHRLYLSAFFVSQAWLNKKNTRWETVSFKHIDKLRFTSDDEANLSNRSIIQITLPVEITESVRAGYLLPVDGSVLKALKQPTSRALYRLLEARRRDPQDPGMVLESFEENVMIWGQVCKLFGGRSDKIRRSLDHAHEELIENGYLKAVEFEGRGKTQTIIYRFNSRVIPEPDKAKVQLLESHGIWPVQARHYAMEYAHLVEPVVRRYQQMLSKGYTPENPAGLIIKMLKEPDQFGVSLQELPASIPAPAEPTIKPPKNPTTEVLSPIDLEGKRGTVTFLAQRLGKRVSMRHLDAFLDRLKNDDAFALSMFEQFSTAMLDSEQQAQLVVSSLQGDGPGF
ncbi:replication initiator protein A [Deinococcus roseus]|uniref:Plasmid replication initiator protein n=1 Tax=Deinococcus roseus TaxID=392414 RepID=A0ABQ2DIP0_9DEIO|nr:replication initiator protein A [Deinococcus roseus]GGJ58977.1 hypothetical protein GCM10008938_51290 [Deinococcus roseus]